MSFNDIECPYCEAPQEINHDDGYGYTEDETFQQECGECEKTFVYRTVISFDYYPEKADCLNGAEHNYKNVVAYPDKYFKKYVRCDDCAHEIREINQNFRA